METRQLTCIGCPLGCQLTVTLEEGKEPVVAGYTCKRGEAYGKKEVTDPTRTVTSSVRVTGGEIAMASVKTRTDIPKNKIFDVMAEIRAVTIPAPVALGQVILPDAAHTGVAVIATKAVDAAE